MQSSISIAAWKNLIWTVYTWISSGFHGFAHSFVMSTSKQRENFHLLESRFICVRLTHQSPAATAHRLEDQRVWSPESRLLRVGLELHGDQFTSAHRPRWRILFQTRCDSTFQLRHQPSSPHFVVCLRLFTPPPQRHHLRFYHTWFPSRIFGLHILSPRLRRNAGHCRCGVVRSVDCSPEGPVCNIWLHILPINTQIKLKNKVNVFSDPQNNCSSYGGMYTGQRSCPHLDDTLNCHYSTEVCFGDFEQAAVVHWQTQEGEGECSWDHWMSLFPLHLFQVLRRQPWTLLSVTTCWWIGGCGCSQRFAEVSSRSYSPTPGQDGLQRPNLAVVFASVLLWWWRRCVVLCVVSGIRASTRCLVVGRSEFRPGSWKKRGCCKKWLVW